MKIRFLQTTESGQPGFPFRAGQVIDVPRLTSEMRAWLTVPAGGIALAEVLKDEPEAAVMPPEERAVLPVAKGKRK